MAENNPEITNNNPETDPKIINTHDLLARPLTDSEYEYLNWDQPFGYPGMVRLRTPLDGSCFFHAIAKSYYKAYKIGKIDGEPLNRTAWIKNLRKDLSIRLGSRIDPQKTESQTYYETLSRGELPNISKDLPGYTLENMQKELDSNESVDNIYNEYISNLLNIDIYILDLIKRDVYVTGGDDDILYKSRPSIVLLYLPGHYELIGIASMPKEQYQSNNTNQIKTIFEPDDDFIQFISYRRIQLIPQ